MSAEGKKRDFCGVVWADTTTAKGARDAIKGGAFALAWTGFSYALMIAFAVLDDSDPFGGQFADESERAAVIMVDVVAAIVAMCLAVWLWRRHSVIAACIGLLWIAFEVTSKAILAPGSGIILSIVLVICAVNGVRAAMAARRGIMQTA